MRRQQELHGAEPGGSRGKAPSPSRECPQALPRQPPAPAKGSRVCEGKGRWNSAAGDCYSVCEIQLEP